MGIEVRNRIQWNEADRCCNRWMAIWFWISFACGSIWLFCFTPFHPFHFVAMIALACICYGGSIIVGGICGLIHCDIKTRFKERKQASTLKDVQLTNFIKGCRNGRN